jgi:2-(3-amino-3-carboxypropyl)histidine synthase
MLRQPEVKFNSITIMSGAPDATAAVVSPAPTRRLQGRKSAQQESTSNDTTIAPVRKFTVKQQIPDDILLNAELQNAVSILPSNYNFEIYKCIWRLREAKATCVALQFPEGLLMYACMISDIFERFASVTTFIMGDVTYGACCVDDYTAIALGADFMIHYGHSCLVPIDQTRIPTMYVFVEIGIDVEHLVQSVRSNFPASQFPRLALAGTIQFTAAVHAARTQLMEQRDYTDIVVPQAKPLSAGEVLGCTAPRFADRDPDRTPCAIMYVSRVNKPYSCFCFVYIFLFDFRRFLADGRFHLESIMIANPEIPAFKYDPYNKKFTAESYDTPQMHSVRREAIAKAADAQRFGLIIGTLGRQGSPHIVDRVEELLKQSGRQYVVICLSEIMPAKLALFAQDVDAWVQVACPRLSTDWGYAFDRPLLTPYELHVALGATAWRDVYPQDFYSADGGPWSNYAHKRKA